MCKDVIYFGLVKIIGGLGNIYCIRITIIEIILYEFNLEINILSKK